MARFALFVLLMAVAASSAFAAHISLSGFSCPAQIPGCAAKRCTTRTLANKQTHICLRCQAGYAAVKGADGKSTVQCVPTPRSSLSGFSCPAQIPGCAAKRCTTRTLAGKQTHVCLRCQAGYMPVKGADGKSTVQCIPAAAAPAVQAAPAPRSSLSGISCPTQIPGCAAKRCTTRTLANKQTHVCLRCQAGYTAVKGADGQSTVQCAPAAAAPAAQAAPAPRSSLSGISCPAQIPGCAAKRCTTRTLANKHIHVCLRCQAGYLPVYGSDGISAVQCMAVAQDSYLLANTTGDATSLQQQQQLVSAPKEYSSVAAFIMAASL